MAQPTLSVEEKYKYTTEKDSVRDKAWAAGSSTIIPSDEYVVSESPSGTLVAEFRTIEYAPAWQKMADEPIVNALDHLIRQLGTDNPVTEIRVTYDLGTGRIRVHNNGPGIEVVVHDVASHHAGKKTYVPTFLFEKLHQGSNRTRASDCIIGGENGIGAKIANYLSLEFVVETYDEARGLLFQQKWKNGSDTTDGPVIATSKTPGAIAKCYPHTTLAFLPDYKHFGYKTPESLAAATQTLCDVIRTRCIYAAAYAHYSIAQHNGPRGKKQKFAFYFNDKRLDFCSMAHIAALFFPDRTVVTTVITPEVDTASKTRCHFRFPWEVCVVVGATGTAPGNVNGVLVKAGKHIKKLSDMIVDCVKDKIGDMFNSKDMKFSASYVTNNLCIMVNAQIPNPKWTGQRKDELDINVRNLAGYKFDKKFATEITKLIEANVSAEILSNQKQATGKKKAVVVDYDKYVKAARSGTKESSKCILLAVEGDSAMNQIQNGVVHSEGTDYIGLISTGGVVMNARKECTITNVTGKSAPTRYVKMSDKFSKNKFWNALFGYTGLNPTYTYDKASPTYKKEIAELRYGALCVTVDQDLDGKGNILGNFISSFGHLFPNLLSAGFLKWFCTPIIRAYPRRAGPVEEFYSTLEYDEWLKTQPSPPPYDVQYFKGLGTHERSELIHMMKNFRSHLYTFYSDEDSERVMNIYYGDDPALRKIELSGPTHVPPAEKLQHMERTLKISCTDHLRYDTNPYQKDNLERKLDHVIDGQNQAGRKILDGLIKAFKRSNKPIKVSVLGGFISQHENYHHGEDSLCRSITSRGFVAPGGKQLPLIVPLSNFGTRLAGGADASAPRYIKGVLNSRLVHLLFPPQDYHVLDFRFDEGQRGEPKHFVPIIPMAVVESTELPGHGWKLETWGRDVFDVIDNVLTMINLTPPAPATPEELKSITLLTMSPCVYRGAEYEWRGEIKHVRGSLYSFGKYTLTERDGVTLLHITELPLRRWVKPYIEFLEKKHSSADGIIMDGDPKDVITDASSDTNVSITVMLRGDAVERLEQCGDHPFIDGIEEYFGLREKLVSHLNLMGRNGEVLEFGGDYAGPFYHWFPVRHAYYIERVLRMEILLQLKIRFYENIVRYVEESIQLKLPKMKEAAMIAMLESKKYDKFNKALLERPKYTPTGELKAKILHDPVHSCYDYLLDMSDRRKSEESLAGYNKQLAALRDELEQLLFKKQTDMFPGKSMWISELNELKNVVREGQRTRWQFENYGKHTYKE